MAHAVQRSARESYRLPPVLKKPVHQILSWTVQDIRYLMGQIRTVDQRIAHEPAVTTTRLRTVPGRGPASSQKSATLAPSPRMTSWPGSPASPGRWRSPGS